MEQTLIVYSITMADEGQATVAFNRAASDPAQRNTSPAMYLTLPSSEAMAFSPGKSYTITFTETA